jgi:hypothetical protein
MNHNQFRNKLHKIIYYLINLLNSFKHFFLPNYPISRMNLYIIFNKFVKRNNSKYL